MLFAKDFLRDQQILASRSETAPVVSVILPTFRRLQGGLLERAIKTVLAQTFQDFELLVMDDGSTDGSNELIESIRQNDPRVIHVRHEQNCGLPALRVNEGIELARGSYLAFQFDDDVWKKNALADLVAEAQAHTEPVVVIGRSLFYTKVGNNYLPPGKVDLVSLYENNQFANNSVLFARSLVDRYGMYDPHIGMRRLCDWDLWLRYIKHVPFITIDSVTSEVFESNTGAIGVTVPWDIPLFRFINSISRDDLLTPANWHDYELDALKIGAAEFQADILSRLYEEQIVPYYFKFRHNFPGLSSFSATLPASPVKSVLYTKQSYDVCNEVTINQYDPLASQRSSYKSYYQTLSEIKPDWTKEADLLVLMRTVEDRAIDLLDQALQFNRPVGLYFDDDLFSFHEFGSKFDYLAPGTPYFQNLTQLTSEVDAVMVTNDYIGDSARNYNLRVIPHNNCVEMGKLPGDIHPRNQSQIRIGYVGSGYRIEEFQKIWDALIGISRKYGDQLVFEFWGIDISSLPPLASKVIQKPFTFSYQYYLESLRQANFDILITPMLDYPKPRLGKSLIKYYEVAVAGALGIFSDVPQYALLESGLTCLKTKNDVEGWYQTLDTAIQMPAEEFDLIRRRCLEHVREEFTESGQIDLHEAALRALEFHARTRMKRHEDGRPRILYVLHSVFFGGAEIQLWRRLRLIRRYGVQPIVVIPNFFKDTDAGHFIQEMLAKEDIQLESVEYSCFTEPLRPSEHDSELERSQIRELLVRYKPALVHTVTFIPSFGHVCQELNIPHVSTLYAVQDDFAWMDEQPGFMHCDVVQSDCLRYADRWGKLLDTAKVCARDMAPDDLFALGQRNYLLSIGQEKVKADNIVRMIVTGTFQERKQQLETIEAVGQLAKDGLTNFELNFYGYTHFFPEYVEKCRQAIRDWGLENQVFIKDFTGDLDRILGSVDILLSLSTYESFPGSIKDAFAAGILVVATPVGGIAELIVDNITGILCKDTSVNSLAEGIRRAMLLPPNLHCVIAERGRKIARLELHPYRAANDIFRMYNLAIERKGIAQSGASLTYQRAESRIERRVSSSPRAKIKTPSRPPSSTMPIGAGLVYELETMNANWMGLDIFVGTHMQPANGQLVLKVISRNGNVLRKVSVDLGRARDNDWLELRFPPIANSSGQKFRLEFLIENPGQGTKVSLYQNSVATSRYIYITRRILQQMGFRLVSQQLYCREWYG